MSAAAETSERALILAPRGRDAGLAAAMLAEAGIAPLVVDTLAGLVARVAEGAGFAVVAEEALASADAAPLVAWLGAQAEWSDLPFILLTSRGGGLERNPAAARHLELLGNVTFLERPFHPTSFISLAQAALRARRRQYDARARLEELRSGAERYRSLFESIDAGFCIVDLTFAPSGEVVEYRFVEANPAFLRQTGLRAGVERRVRELSPEHEHHWFDTYGQVARTGEAVRFEHDAPLLGQCYDVYAFRVGAAGSNRVAVLFNDISDRREAQEQLRNLTVSLEERVVSATRERELALAQLHEAQKLETLGQLTGGVAHDFNNLLTPIIGALDLLGRRHRGEARSTRLLEGAMEAAERARILVQRLLGFARRQALQTRPVDLAGLLEVMRDLISSSVGAVIELRLSCEPDLPPAMADPNQLELALLNLCVNARDAMPGGGVLTVRAEKAEIAGGEGPGIAPGTYVRLSVIDTGVGMDAETLAHAVEPFYSTKELGKGTGLGLSMVHGFASQIGGGLGLSSAPGAGTRVDLWLPAAEEPARATPRPAPAPPTRVKPMSVLLVDDEQLVREATAEMLRDLGHEVAEAANGSEALAKLADRSPDIVVTDFNMPRMTGSELAQRIRQSWPGMPILLITGYSGMTEVDPTLSYLEKPFRRLDLADAIQRVAAPPSRTAPQG